MAEPLVENLRVIRIGLGDFVVSTGTYVGEPAIFIEPAEVRGPVGQFAGNSDMNDVADNSTILVFKGDARVLRDAILKFCPIEETK